ncbi:ATP-binding cassette domain-containing protein [Mesorhizobium sp. M2A.F.Ca.ET.037.01.1.1]|uniref:ABC transporter ATP-binding protein n=1 Tax=unclassified Mesorhizobium TaxID=325217 RepID=UPI000F75533D|nr:MULTISPECIES: ABC transporter ATP-binding protein [unclassified Mesorhizobium]RVC65958.1 ATP-binding cassette domain-containing protein [Mesorhizobium sp. M00.F.Ca.ET.038.03.1.1]AZO34868.1 ABC transporter ATP-binding protein [Mesorhizobium sp. M2A.F.Ca.ET.046.03.2.1]RUX21136.1 ATP-binding cassette domain-containing protein [Mesorhizobium sp. M2A.F.Ca.ET.037.01.1.1]RWA92976.1 MAG: ATP-binding cassette domain-containing protein [Mesorhizobium sp.]RWB41917.1 MAG: ATP-binding cassette domain-co
MSACLDIRSLSAVLPNGQRVLRSVSLAVQPGEVRALVGESGAGKTMIGKAVLGVLPKSVRIVEGEMLIEGEDLGRLDAKARRTLIGARTALIPQDPLTALNPSRRIGAQMTDRLVRILGWSGERADKRIRQLLDEVQIRDPERVLKSYPHELSGGMRQRVLIAAAFAAEPRLIVADEPTTALDVTVQKQILRLIAQLQRDHGTAILFVTHDLGVVAKISQKVSVLYAGKVVEEAETAQLFAAPQHAYTRALIAATPRYTDPYASLKPVDESVLAGLTAEIAAADKDWRPSHG